MYKISGRYDFYATWSVPTFTTGERVYLISCEKQEVAIHGHLSRLFWSQHCEWSPSTATDDGEPLSRTGDRQTFGYANRHYGVLTYWVVIADSKNVTGVRIPDWYLGTIFQI